MKRLAAGLAALALTTGLANAATLDFTPTADGEVRIFGGDSVETGGGTLAFFQSGQNITNVIMEFDLSALAGASSIDGATLHLTLNRFISNVPSITTAEIDIFAYAGDGVVTIADYDAAGTQVLDTTIPTGGTQFDSLSFTLSDLAPLQALAGGLLTLRLETDNFASISLLSIEQMFGQGFAPRLSVDFTPGQTVNPVPVPAALPLFAACLGGLGLFRRPRKLVGGNN